MAKRKQTPKSRTEAIPKRIASIEERIRLINEGPFGRRTRELTRAENLAVRAKRQRIKELSTELRNLRTAAVKVKQKPKHI